MLRGRDLVFVATVGTTAVALVIAVTLAVSHPTPQAAVLLTIRGETQPERPAQGLTFAPLPVPTAWAWRLSLPQARSGAFTPHRPAPRAGHDLRTFLENMARASREHTAIGLADDADGMPWVDDGAKSEHSS